MSSNISFFGQRVYGDGDDANVSCPVCHKRVNLHCGGSNQDNGLSWFDPYRGKNGKYAHFECLSDRRITELKKEDLHVSTI